MNRKLTAFVLAITLITSFPAVVSADAYTGFMSIDSVQARPGEQFGVKVELHDNNAAFSALMVPIRYVSPYLTLDSVSFVGSIKPLSFTGIGFDHEDIQLVKISYIYVAGSVPPPSIQDTAGVIAELFFTLSADATPQFIPIDSASIDSFIIVGEDTVTNFWTGVVLSNATGDSTYFPDCIAGGVEVLSPTDVN
jgi:hypothetical protein